MTSPDIRAGISLLIAALSAKGTSIINNIEQIDRGYENIEARLKSIGAKMNVLKLKTCNFLKLELLNKKNSVNLTLFFCWQHFCLSTCII